VAHVYAYIFTKNRGLRLEFDISTKQTIAAVDMRQTYLVYYTRWENCFPSHPHLCITLPVIQEKKDSFA